ncbi:3-deoxy-7-phosphoheptulonate synthase [Tomitella fengzijianii]|uniref:Phospho-2-dehydro-3-deoxyheptonate aldolase n=1 Tax=Tomitella fengzijianii TaxID=2597660 RepID=A0A516X220_9ACTN|nr:3-deoxy-7-phosphoheptulonate synthase [Tomitella fengzijianii]QDQ97134.1 3-deoxy-7-phosphoheptulonate synthase [Tomitella fengzijianii]
MTTILDTPAGAASTTDRNVAGFDHLPTPRELVGAQPLGADRARLVERSRDEIARVLDGTDDRVLLVVGPCSVHDPDAARDYAARLAAVAREVRDDVLVVMRVYFEKPRTTTGWKGLINDPGLDETFDVPRGLRVARDLLLDVLDEGLPVGCEFLEPISPQYIADAVSWGAIGARTTESQVHRQLASGLSMPIGFKNATDGNVQVAVDGCGAARAPHVFFGSTEEGRTAIVRTRGNAEGHVILRGGRGGSNFAPADVSGAVERLRAAGLAERVMIDASHANSGKDDVRQVAVAREIAGRIAAGEDAIAAVMLESFIEAGNQGLDADPLVYGKSVTDKCMAWGDTADLLREFAAAVRAARELRGATADGAPSAGQMNV